IYGSRLKNKERRPLVPPPSANRGVHEFRIASILSVYCQIVILNALLLEVFPIFYDCPGPFIC
ncbi:hypothetical protein LRN11_19085, partial [Bacillus licheniformis]|uniref:hypothetical protein n=1 Tax=Bacillus licheniformis TaxID=1402 RepID=UPI001E5FC050